MNGRWTRGLMWMAAVVALGVSAGVLTGLSGDLSGVRLDMRGDSYGCAARRGGVVAGRQVLFPSPQRGICSLEQNELGLTRGMDVPFSTELERVVKRINWGAGERIRLDGW